MKFKALFVSVAAPLILASAAHAADTSKASCEKLATSVKLADTALKTSYVTTKDELTAAMMLSAGKTPSAAEAAALPMCRVEIVITPAPGAEIKSELWLPESSKWNKRFLSAGIGGAAGYIDREQLIAGAAQGYATSTSDAGSHSPTSLEFTFGRNIEWRKNYTGRGVHLTAVTGKALIQAYYSAKPKASLFYGCSGGGYEGLGEVQFYPEDYDGVLAGDPPVNWLRQVIWQGRAYAISHKEPGGSVPVEKIPALSKGVIGQCDGFDGVTDGVIDDPRKCKPDFTKMLCKDADGNECFTAPQVKTLTALYAPWTNSRSEFVYPGFTAGSETAPAARIRISSIDGQSVMSPAKPGPMLWHLPETFKPEEWMTYDFDKGVPDEETKFAPYAHDKTDMSAFKKAGGKLILFSGWADPNLNPQNLVNYYANVQKTMGDGDVASFSRLFMVPGLNHCSGGPGTNSLGQTMDEALGTKHDASNNILLALDKWVTEGVAPEQVVGRKYIDDKKEKGIARTRPICAYPKVAKWDGKGNTDDAKSFSCVAP